VRLLVGVAVVRPAGARAPWWIVTPPPPEALAAVMCGLAEAGTVSAKTVPTPMASVIALMMFDLFM
jgi:hypothetical protein